MNLKQPGNQESNQVGKLIGEYTTAKQPLPNKKDKGNNGKKNKKLIKIIGIIFVLFVISRLFSGGSSNKDKEVVEDISTVQSTNNTADNAQEEASINKGAFEISTEVAETITEEIIRKSLNIPEDADIEVQHINRKSVAGSPTKSDEIKVIGKGEYEGYTATGAFNIENGAKSWGLKWGNEKDSTASVKEITKEEVREMEEAIINPVIPEGDNASDKKDELRALDKKIGEYLTEVSEYMVDFNKALESNKIDNLKKENSQLQKRFDEIIQDLSAPEIEQYEEAMDYIVLVGAYIMNMQSFANYTVDYIETGSNESSQEMAQYAEAMKAYNAMVPEERVKFHKAAGLN